MSFRARLFESRLTLTWDLNLTKVTVSLIQRVFTANSNERLESNQTQNEAQK